MKETALHRFEKMPADAQKALKDAALKHGVDYLDLIPDQGHLVTLQTARRDAIRVIYRHHQAAQIAEWFGVSRVAINNAVRADRTDPSRRDFVGQGTRVPPILRRKPKVKA